MLFNSNPSNLSSIFTVDNVNNKVVLSVPDQSWPSAGGAVNNALVKVLFYYEEGDPRRHVGVAGAQCRERLLRVPHPAFHFGGRRGLREEGFQMRHRAREVLALEQQKREPVMRPGELRRDVERTSIRTNGLLEPSGLGVGDRDILQDSGIVGMVAQRETIRGQRGVEIALPLERERLAQIVEALGLELAVRLATKQAAPPGHRKRGGREESGKKLGPRGAG